MLTVLSHMKKTSTGSLKVSVSALALKGQTPRLWLSKDGLPRLSLVL